MRAEQDINRCLLLLATKINDCDQELEDLAARIKDLDTTAEYTENVSGLTERQEEVKVEFSKAVNMLFESTNLRKLSS